MPHSHFPPDHSDFQDLASVLLPLNREIARSAALQAGAAAQRARAAAERAQQARDRAHHIAERLAQVRRRLRGAR
ncbi:hypothetical protein GCM10009850_083210 [Nonomuraea monospora]|uniref:Uncharacterized protein n=1 Tax=Nonomuraea monospora TaxID=568818 RepID=A0ABN3CTU4_9ACTN